ncbi:alpha/beta fold hydrolase [Halobellus sp. GM3]|uniref:alpha/beta fold hydrolase n=1 Tax=Halobellus sp. GM3 TaxID=3458410 RepID=UPI00403DBD1E
MSTSVPDDGAIGDYEPRFVTVDGLETRYYELGEGPALVLIHGGTWGGSSSANTWVPALSHLAEHFRVYAFDRLGCGLTGAPADTDRFVFPEAVEHARGFIDAVGIERYHLVGSSRGAGVAAVAALEETDRIETVTLLNSATISPAKGDLGHRMSRLNRGIPPADGSVERERERAEYRYGTYSYSTDHVTDADLDATARMACTDESRRIDEAFEGEAGETFATSLASTISDAHKRIANGELSVPTLVCWGRNDVTVSLSAGTALFDMLSAADETIRLRVINQCGHLPFREYPEEFARVVTEFADLAGDRPLRSE